MFEREFNGKMARPRWGLAIPLFLFWVVLLFASGTSAQWRKLATFKIPNPSYDVDLGIESIYFLDLPGPPRIGFIGLMVPTSSDSTVDGAQLWKTTDGGISWRKVAPLMGRALIGVGISDITFKDSLTGWFSLDQSFNDSGSVYKTTDAGESWTRLNGSGWNSNFSLCYHAATDLLFLGSQVASRVSSDEGATWESAPYFFAGCAFASDSIGITCGWAQSYGYPEYPNDYTKNGGRTWQTSNMGTDCMHPLAIAGTGTFFATDDSDNRTVNNAYFDTLYKLLYRSDDSGKTWQFVSFIPVGDSADYAPTGHLTGDLNHIYTQTSAGVLLSTDQGRTWQNLCGPKFPIQQSGIAYGGFYQKSQYIYCTDGHEVRDSAHLWYLNLDSLNLVSSNFAEQLGNGAKQETIYPGDTVRVDYFSDTALGPEVGTDSVFLSISFDALSLALARFELAPGWSIVDSSHSGGNYRLLLVNSDSLALDSSTRILRADFASYLAIPSSKVYLDSVHYYGHRLNCDCAVQSVLAADTSTLATAIDSVEIDFSGCGDSTILAVMHGEPVFSIQSIAPNPAENSLRVEGNGQGVTAELDDALGRSVLGNPTTPQPPPLGRGWGVTLDVSSVPSGIYYLRLSAGGYVESRSVVIQK